MGSHVAQGGTGTAGNGPLWLFSRIFLVCCCVWRAHKNATLSPSTTSPTEPNISVVHHTHHTASKLFVYHLALLHSHHCKDQHMHSVTKWRQLLAQKECSQWATELFKEMSLPPGSPKPNSPQLPPQHFVFSSQRRYRCPQCRSHQGKLMWLTLSFSAVPCQRGMTKMPVVEGNGVHTNKEGDV